MSTAYPSLSASDLAADKPALTTNVSGIIAVHECVARKPFALFFVEQTRTNIAYGDMYGFELLCMEYMTVAGRYIIGTISAKVDAGTGTIAVVDADNGDALISDEVPVTANAYDDHTITVTIPAGWDAFTLRTLAIQGKATVGDTLYIQSSAYVQWYCTD